MEIKPMLRAVGVGASLAVIVGVSGCTPSGPPMPRTAIAAECRLVHDGLEMLESDPPLPMLR